MIQRGSSRRGAFPFRVSATAPGRRPGRWLFFVLGLLVLGLVLRSRPATGPEGLSAPRPVDPPGLRPEQVRQLETAARAGLPSAMVALGRWHHEAGRVEQARDWFSRSAARGDGDALYHLGLVDSLHGDSLWARAAHKGHAAAAWRLGERLLARGLPPDSVRTWFDRAARAGLVEARASLGLLLLSAATNAADSLTARGWLNTAADGGEPRAQTLRVEWALARRSHGDSLAALAELRELALGGHGPARLRLAGLLLEGPLAWRLEREGAFWLRLAAEAGEPAAFAPWARCLEWGRGTATRAWAARRWYRKAADRGDGLAALRLGRMFREGRGGDPDRHQALAWFVRSQQLGQPEALEELGRHFEHGSRPGDARRLAALAWYTEGALRQHGPSQLALARLLIQSAGDSTEREQALGWLEQAALTHLPARLELARWTLEGTARPADPGLALALYHQAASEGSREALFALGGLHLRGLGTQRDRRAAYHLFHQAAVRGLGEAWLELGRCYQLGWGTPADFQRAEHCFEQAERLGVPLAPSVFPM